MYGTPERVAKLRELAAKRQDSMTIVLENVHDPHNVSAVLRSCDATGVLNVHCVYTGHQKFPDLGRKSSASAWKWVNLIKHRSIEECYSALRQTGKRIYTTHLDSDATELYAVDFTQPTAIVFGNEHHGVSDEARTFADGNMRIPQLGIVQSLNISVACAVTLFEAMRQRLHAGMYNQPQLSDTAMNQQIVAWLRDNK
ncbi:MAG: RNA methyltransferase [Candidatus Kapabacteria bacterium]|nr:RNA methyltransferase [Candidatus Kapabacteria bacterium]